MFQTYEGTYECDHCKAKYNVTFTCYPGRDNDWHICDVCGKKFEWNDTHSPGNFRLIPDQSKKPTGKSATQK